MKSKLLLLSMCAVCAVSSVNAQNAEATEVELNFKDITTLTFKPIPLGELKDATYMNGDKEAPRVKQDKKNEILIIVDETLEKNGVGVNVTKGTTSYPRIFFAGTQNGHTGLTYADFVSDMRWYAGATLTVTAPEGKQIDKIVMIPVDPENNAKRCAETIVETEGGTQDVSDLTQNVWTASANTHVNKVVYKAPDNAKTQAIYTMTVTVSEFKGSGVASIEAEDNAVPEYYNLAGVRCEGELAPGLYIRKAGSKVSKVLVK